jgi:hypothetical protein
MKLNFEGSTKFCFNLWVNEAKGWGREMEEIGDYIHDSCIDMALVLLIFLIDMGIDCIYLSYEDVYHNGTFLLSFFNFKFFGLKNFF